MKYDKIETSYEGLLLEVELGYVCNYKCSYCAPSVHTGNTWINHEKLLNFIKKAAPTTVLLTGGEPTLYPTIETLLKKLKEGSSVELTSNGSRSLSWWKTYSPFINKLTLSYHIEHANIDSFIKKLEYLSDHRVVTVYLCMMIDRFDECLEISKEISKIKNVYIYLKALKDITIHKLFEYTDKQLLIMSNMIKPKVVTKYNDSSINVYGRNENNELDKLKIQTIVSNKENMYKGWVCWKGIHNMKLIWNGNLYKAACDLNDEKCFGNIYNDEVILSTEPEICQKDYCHCLMDVKMIDKEKL